MKLTQPSDVSTIEMILNETHPALGRVWYLLPKIIFNKTHLAGDVSTTKNYFQ